jgi:CRISPR-associated protein Csm3
MKLLKYKKIKGQIKLVTGLHIGGSKEEIRIGETDNPVIKHPIDNFPYIPGSSLKGKVRTLVGMAPG